MNKEEMRKYMDLQLEKISNPEYIKSIEEKEGRKLTLEEVAKHYASYDAKKFSEEHSH
jgi:hypothetical protein